MIQYKDPDFRLPNSHGCLSIGVGQVVRARARGKGVPITLATMRIRLGHIAIDKAGSQG